MLKTLLMAAAASVLGVGATTAATKPTIVFVHGAFENASVWRGVEAGLRSSGYETIAIDLPGRPSNPLSPADVSLATYRGAVLKAIDAVKTPVVLVGHSFGGIVISDVAAAEPSKVKTLIYVAAFLPRDGESLVSLANQDKDSAAGPQIQFLKDRGLASIPEAARGDLFANDGTAEQKSLVASAIVDEPLAPLAEPVHLGATFAHVDKVYIETARDRVISPAAQKAMIAATRVRATFTLDTGHAAFLTGGPALVTAIEKAIQ